MSTLTKTSSNGFSNGHKGGTNEAGSNNFEALLQTQTIHDVPDEINAPKGKVMQQRESHSRPPRPPPLVVPPQNQILHLQEIRRSFVIQIL